MNFKIADFFFYQSLSENFFQVLGDKNYMKKLPALFLIVLCWSYAILELDDSFTHCEVLLVYVRR